MTENINWLLKKSKLEPTMRIWTPVTWAEALYATHEATMACCLQVSLYNTSFCQKALWCSSRLTSPICERTQEVNLVGMKILFLAILTRPPPLLSAWLQVVVLLDLSRRLENKLLLLSPSFYWQRSRRCYGTSAQSHLHSCCVLCIVSENTGSFHLWLYYLCSLN